MTGVRGKGVVANWEATAGHRRAPELRTLLLLARWYGVSLDYLFGTPGAERDSPGVKLSKAVLQRAFSETMAQMVHPSPSQRIATAYQILRNADPEAWFDERVVLVLGIELDHWRAILEGQTPTDSVMSRFAATAGVAVHLLYADNRSFGRR